MTSTTLENLYGAISDDVTTCLEEQFALVEQGEFLSPEFVDKLVWGVAVAFAVGSAANVFTSVLLRGFPRRVQDTEVAAVKTDALKNVIEIKEPKDEQILSMVLEQLPSNIRHEKRQAIAVKITQIFRERVIERGAEK